MDDGTTTMAQGSAKQKKQSWLTQAQTQHTTVHGKVSEAAALTPASSNSNVPQPSNYFGV